MMIDIRCHESSAPEDKHVCCALLSLTKRFPHFLTHFMPYECMSKEVLLESPVKQPNLPLRTRPS